MLGKFCLASTETAEAPAPMASNTAPMAGDRELLAARDAYDRRALKALAATREQFRGPLARHPLAAYVEYWWLLANLSQGAAFAVTNAQDFKSFLAAQGDGALAESLRREWLRALARQESWESFSAEYPRLNVDDPDLACHQWRYRLKQGDRAALTEIRAFWNAARPASDACYDAFDSLRAAQMLGTEMGWMRVRRLLEDKELADARRSAAYIDKLPAAFERTTASIGMNPAAWLEKERVNPRSRASVELFLFALTRVARSEAGKAAALLEKRGQELSPEDRRYAWSQVALGGAMQHDPDALSWFAEAKDFPLNDNQLGWKARAALRAGDWAALKAAVQAMSAQEKRDSAWRYWLARAEAASGNAATAAQLRESLAHENNFYGLLAAEELGISPAVSWTGWKPAKADLDGVRELAGIKRALALYRLDMKNDGLREWQFAIRNMSDQQLLTAAEVARQAGIPDRAINTAERTLALHDYSLRFPMPYRGDLKAQTRAQGLDEYWVYGLIRQESRFMADAKSRVGATGLMQLMPATAQWAARQVGMNGYRPERTGEVGVNLTLGSFYLRHVLDDLGHPVLATAAYNAGPGRARRWRAEQALEGAVYAESIPFTETRDYVKKVMANAWYYANQAGLPGRSLKEMVGTVPGKRDGRAGTSSLVSATTSSLR